MGGFAKETKKNMPNTMCQQESGCWVMMTGFLITTGKLMTKLGLKFEVWTDWSWQWGARVGLAKPTGATVAVQVVGLRQHVRGYPMWCLSCLASSLCLFFFFFSCKVKKKSITLSKICLLHSPPSLANGTKKEVILKWKGHICSSKTPNSSTVLVCYQV